MDTVVGLILLVLAVALLVFIVFGLVDSLRRPSSAFEAAGKSKTVWVVLFIVGLFIHLVGLIAGIIYFSSVRPKVIAAGG